MSIDAENAFNKMQQSFMITTLQKVGIEGNYLNIIKAVYNKLTSFSGSPVAQLVKKPPAMQETWV